MCRTAGRLQKTHPPAGSTHDRPEMKKFVKEILDPVGRLHGDDLPVSAFADRADGVYPAGSAAFEKRGIAITVPQWDGTKCAQCNLCAMSALMQ